MIDKDCSIRNVYARQYVYLISSLKSFRLYSDHLNNLLSLFRDLINQSSSTIESKYIFEQSAILFETILSPPKLKNLRFAVTTIATSSSTDLSSIDSTTFQTEDDEIDDNNQKETYLIQFATDLCQYCFQFCTEHSNRSSFEHSLDLFTRLLSFTTSNNTEIITKLTNSTEQTTTIPEIFYSNYARPLIIIAIEQHCSLDCIVELTIQILNTFDSSEVVVERVLADLIQVGKKTQKNFICLFEF